MNLSSFTIKHKQYFLAGVIGAIGLGIAGLIILTINNGKPTETNHQPVQETQIATAGQRVNPQEVWVERVESENKITRQKLETLEKLMMENVKAAAESQNRYATLQEELYENQSRQEEDSSNVLPQVSEGQGLGPLAPSLTKIVLNLSNAPGTSKGLINRSTVENTIPAGAFAKAVLLGGVDASVSVQAQSDPRPVLLRIVDHGNLPRKFRSDLKACHVLASSYGDLSSERVFMRLEKLTCTERLTGEISETQVAGYVLGEDGRAGIRGVVADRSGPLLRNSLAAGFLSGMGEFFSAQQEKGSYPLSPFGGSHALSPGQMMTAGAGQGASEAMNRLGDFFVKRLEQLQPVLQVAAGRQVDIVFTQGTKFGETDVRNTITKVRNHSRQKAIQSLGESQDNSEWLPSMNQEAGE